MRRDSRGVIRPFVNTKRPLFPSITELLKEAATTSLERRRLLAENTVGLSRVPRDIPSTILPVLGRYMIAYSHGWR